MELSWQHPQFTVNIDLFDFIEVTIKYFNNEQAMQKAKHN